MYCCKCGEANPDDALYCYKCGKPLYRGPATSEEQLNLQPERSIPEGEPRQLAEQLLSVDPKSHECHRCSKAGDLYGLDFGLGKIISAKTNRAWRETAVSAALAALSVHFIGLGMVRLPGKKTKTTIDVLRLRLNLCGTCRREQRMVFDGADKIDPVVYALHPLWDTAQRFGYTEFLDAARLSALEPVT